MSRPRVVIVAKRTLYGRYVEDEDDLRARQLVSRHDRSVSNWLAVHEEHKRTLEAVRTALHRLGAQVFLVRQAGAQFDPTDADLVVAVGGDGTLLAASHNVKRTPILGINSAPRYSVGSYCAGRRGTLGRLLPAALDGSLPSVALTRMRLTVNGHLRSARILNEVLFCHRCPAATSRYIIGCGRRREEHRSSGFWIGTAAGSAGAQRSAGGKVLPLTSQQLQLVVREPYRMPGKEYRLLRAIVEPGHRVTAKSKMQDARMFLDGPYKQLRVALGDVVTFSPTGDPLNVLGLTARRARRR